MTGDREAGHSSGVSVLGLPYRKAPPHLGLDLGQRPRIALVACPHDRPSVPLSLSCHSSISPPFDTRPTVRPGQVVRSAMRNLLLAGHGTIVLERAYVEVAKATDAVALRLGRGQPTMGFAELRDEYRVRMFGRPLTPMDLRG